jgi:hypothetical protein
MGMGFLFEPRFVLGREIRILVTEKRGSHRGRRENITEDTEKTCGSSL